MFEKDIEGVTQFYNFSMFDFEGFRKFEFIEGSIIKDFYHSTNELDSYVTIGKETFQASNLVCASKTTCWVLNCKVK